MKKIRLLSLLAASVLLFSACQKKYCWQCNTYVIGSKGLGSNKNPIKSTVCDKTEKQIRQYEQDNELREKISNDGVYRIVSQMDCKR